MEKEYLEKKKDVLEIIDFYKENKRRPKQDATSKKERSLSAKLTKFQSHYRNNQTGTKLPDDLLKLLLDEGLISTKEDEIKKAHEQKEKDVLEIIKWANEHKRKPTQSVSDSYERLLALRLNNYQKYYRNPSNGTKLPDDLLNLLIENNLVSKEEEKNDIDYKKKQDEVRELLLWIKLSNKTPSTISNDELERKLGIRLNNYRQYYRKTGKGVKLPDDLLKILLDEGLITPKEENDKKEEKIGKERQKINYEGVEYTFQSLAKHLEVDSKTLRRNYEIYGSINRAIDMIKFRKKKNMPERNYETLKSEFNLNDADIKTIKNFEKKHEKLKSDEKLPLYNGQTLHTYCIENGINYDFVKRKIKEGLTPTDAINLYINGGSKEPSWYIYNKSGQAFSYVMRQYQMNSLDIIELIKKKNMSLNDAVLYKCIEKYSKNYKLSKSDIKYLYDIGYTFKDEDYFLTDVEDAFNLNSHEWKALLEGTRQADIIIRDMKLFELSKKIGDMPSEEIINTLEKYNLLNEQTLKRIFFEQGTIYDEKYFESKKSDDIKRILSSIGSDFILLTYDDKELDNDELSMKNYIRSIISRYNIDDEKVNYFVLLSKKYNDTKCLMDKIKKNESMR